MTVWTDDPATPDEIEQALESLRTLTHSLDDPGVDTVLVGGDGLWQCDRTGTLKATDPPLSADVSRALVQAVRRHGPSCCHGGWWIQLVDSFPRDTVVLQRRPVPGRGVSNHTLELLQARLQAGCCGMIFGPSRSGRATLLVSLLKFFDVDFAAYIGDIPPMIPQQQRLMVLPVPTDDRQRHRLAPIIERAPVVLFDTPVTAADVRLLFSGGNPTGRWLTADISSPRPDQEFLQPLERLLDTRIGVQGTPANSVRVHHFSMCDADGWHPLLDGGQPHQSPAGTDETTTTIDPSSHEMATAPRSISGDDDNATTNPETPSRLNERSAPVEQGPPPRTGDESPGTDAELRESGEIQIPGFAPSSEARTCDEDTDVEPRPRPDADQPLRGSRIDDELPELVATRDVDDVEIPELDPRQLRRTFEGEVDADTLREIRQMRRQQRDNNRSDDDPGGEQPGGTEELGRFDSETEQLDAVSREPETDELDSDSEPETTEITVDDSEVQTARITLDDDDLPDDS